MADAVTVQTRGRDGRRLPAGSQAPTGRVRDVALARWAEARTDMERLAVAVDYARAAAAAAGRGGVDPAEQLARATRVAWAVGEALVAALAEAGGGRE